MTVRKSLVMCANNSLRNWGCDGVRKREESTQATSMNGDQEDMVWLADTHKLPVKRKRCKITRGDVLTASL